MSNSTNKNKRRPAPPEASASGIKTNLELTPEAAQCLVRLKANHGITRTFAVSRGVILQEQTLRGDRAN